MGVISEIDQVNKEQGTAAPIEETAAYEQAPPQSSPAAEVEPPSTESTDDEKRQAHEAAEAKRKAEWETAQAARKEAEARALAELEAMSDETVAANSLKKVNADIERLTRRNMKYCIAEHIQTKCLDDAAFARLTMNPRKNMIRCFHYINRKAKEYLEQEAEDLQEARMAGGIGGDVPDEFVYEWAEAYFQDTEAKEDEIKEEKFVPKPYSGGAKKTSKPRAKKPAAKKTPEKPEDNGQISLLEAQSA